MEDEHLRLPAKFGSIDENGVIAYHPLYCHMLDVFAVCDALWVDVVPFARQHAVADAAGLDLESARRWVAFLAGLHDLGKAAPAFLAHLPESARGGLLGEHFTMPRGAVKPGDAPHGCVSAVVLSELLAERCGIVRATAEALAVVVGGHHGIFPSAAQLNTARNSSGMGTGRWAAARLALFEALHDAAAIAGAPRPQRLSNPGVMMIAGMVTVADWIGSSEHFPFLVDDIRHPATILDVGGYPAIARTRAANALRSLGWTRPIPSSVRTPLQQRIGKPPRPLQIVADATAAAVSTPALIVVEAPTGEGKTEAAFVAADAFERNGSGGSYFALPTRATSDQMYSRARGFLARAHGGELVLLQLLHGHASLSGEFADVLRVGVQPTDVDPDGDVTESTVAASAWFTYRKRGLLAPYGVGTIDQALIAAEQTKHVFVRLFGLSGKTLVVDEVHAYDTYMSRLLERLLEWLAAVETNVVLLSATLPSSRLRRLTNAYARGLGSPAGGATLASYPRITSIATSGTESVAFEVSDAARRTVAIQWIGLPSTSSRANDELAQMLHDLLRAGGCAAVICNTVGRAQEVYRALHAFFVSTDVSHDIDIDVLHARLPADEREVRERHCIERFGSPDDARSSGSRPKRAILVATQVIEQSLDLDFDVMFTDLAPVDLLIQRAGRLHRHERARPPGLEQPALHVRAPSCDADGVPTLEQGDARVYEPHVLLRTWLALEHRTSVRAPEDIEGLIEAVYDDERACPVSTGARLRSFWDETRGAMLTEREREANEAASRWLRPPYADVPLDEFTGAQLDEDAPEIHAAHQALTRLGDPSVEVVCLVGTEEAPRLASGERIDVHQVPARGVARALLGRSLSISTRGLVSALLDVPVPTGWRRSPLLRHHRALVFDADGVCRIRGWLLRLDDETGLEIAFEGRR